MLPSIYAHEYAGEKNQNITIVSLREAYCFSKLSYITDLLNLTLELKKKHLSKTVYFTAMTMAFLCGVSMFSMRLCGFSLGAAPHPHSHIPKTCMITTWCEHGCLIVSLCGVKIIFPSLQNKEIA